jgi:RND family efflux transporter MFP subunit
MKKKQWMLTLLSIFLFLTGCSDSKQESKKEKYANIATVQVANAHTCLQIPGRTKAADEAGVSFRVSGTLQEVPVKEGDYVRKGQLLARMDARDYQVQLDATEAEYQRIKSEAERIMAVYAEGGTTADNNDKAKYGLRQITAKLEHAKDQLNDTRIYAPFDGYVNDIYFKANETVGAGMPVVSLFGANKVEVEVELSATDYANRATFDSYYCTFSVTGDEQFRLTPVIVERKANANQLYRMRLSIEGTYPEITPGMTTMVTICPKSGQETDTEIPATAIFTDNDRNCVYVYEGGTLHRRTVTLLHLNSDGTARVGSELKAGEQVVASGVHFLKDGERVTPVAKRTKTNVGGLL